MRLATFLSLLFAAASLSAQISGRYADWAGGPVRHLMTKDEVKQWKTIASDAEAKALIDLFWAKRDPTPATPRNEFHELFDSRVAFADQQFSNGRERGSLTDPGKAFILLGPPYNVRGSGGGHSYQIRARLMWTYAHDKKPKYVPQSDFMLVFEDQGINDWELARTERLNPEVIIQEAVNGLIVSPNLKRAPFPANTSDRTSSKSFHDLLLEAAYKEFRSSGKTSTTSGNLTWAEFVTEDGQPLIAAQLYAAASSGIVAGQSVTLFSVVENSAGEVVDVRESPETMIASGPDAYVNTSIVLHPGSYTATFGVATRSSEKILAAVRTPIAVDKIDPTAPGVSPLLLASSISPLTNASEPLDPFTFGGLKVIPKGDAQFTPKGDLWYFLELRNPGLLSDVPKLRVSVDIEGQTAKGPAAMKLPIEEKKAVKLANNRYAIGTAIPLEGFIPGDYTIRVHVEDSVLGTHYDVERKFRVRPL